MSPTKRMATCGCVVSAPATAGSGAIDTIVVNQKKTVAPAPAYCLKKLGDVTPPLGDGMRQLLSLGLITLNASH